LNYGEIGYICIDIFTIPPMKHSFDIIVYQTVSDTK